MSEAIADETRTIVREHYAKVSTGAVGCAPGCCGAMPTDQSRMLGYSADDLAAVPEGADMGLGCGNPAAIASLRAGETVLDLGASAGFDAVLAARAVGPTGRVIGVDMTPEMVALARTNARKVNAGRDGRRLGHRDEVARPARTRAVALRARGVVRDRGRRGRGRHGRRPPPESVVSFAGNVFVFQRSTRRDRSTRR